MLQVFWKIIAEFVSRIWRKRRFFNQNNIHFAKDHFIKILALLIFVFASSGFTQDSNRSLNSTGIQMKVEAALDGYFKYGEWLLIWVELENSGPDISAEIQVTINSTNGVVTYITPVELPNVSHKRFPVYVLANNFSRELELKLVSGEESITSKKVSVQPRPNSTYLIGLISSERGVISLVNIVSFQDSNRSKEILDLSISDFPDRYEVLRSLDLIIVNNIDTSTLTTEQAFALEKWVEQGGRLVVGGGANAQITLIGLPKSLLSLSIEDTIQVESLPELVTYIGVDKPIRISGPFIVADGKSETGNLILSQDDIPLIYEWQREKGFIDYVSLDLNMSPFDAWSGTVDFWEKLISPGTDYPDTLPADRSTRQITASQLPPILTNLPMLDFPSMQVLAILLLIYIVLVGPINYFVLIRLNRLHWAWISIPSLTVLFSLVSFGYSFASQGSDNFINKISFIQLQNNGDAYANSYFGFFSPSQGDYDLEIRGDGLISPLITYEEITDAGSSSSVAGDGRDILLVQGDPAFVRDLDVEQWSIQNFLSEGNQYHFGPVVAGFVIENESLVGEVVNGSSNYIKDAAVIFGSQIELLGDLSPGETASVRMVLDDLSKPGNGSSLGGRLFEQKINSQIPAAEKRHLEVQRSIVDTLFDRIPAYLSTRLPAGNRTNSLLIESILLGWIENAPPDVMVSGNLVAQQTTAIIVMSVPFYFPEQGQVILPPGLIPGQVKSMPGEGGWCGIPGSLALNILSGEAILEFSLPVDLSDVNVTNLRFALNTDNGWQAIPAVSIYDWRNNTWVDLNGIVQGVNNISNNDNLVSSDGLIDIRLSTENTQTCYYVGLGIEGQRE